MDANAPLEIERKFLIRYPEEAVLDRVPGVRRAKIEQIYLTAQGGETRRIRRWEEDGSVRYVRTVKRGLTAMTRIEIEDDISPETYEELKEEADPRTRPIVKTRLVVPDGDLHFEADLYPFWTRMAVLEEELPSEETPVNVPELFDVIREVTEDPRYTNAALSRMADGELREMEEAELRAAEPAE